MRVRDLCFINHKNLNTDIEFDSYLYLDTGNITENLIDNVQLFKNRDELPSRAKRLVLPGDIIISTVRPIQKHYGILGKPENNLLVSTGFAVLTPKKEIVNGHYLYYYLTQEKITNYFQMIAESSVSSYPSITSDIIGNVEIDLPPIDEQNRIANIIMNVDAKISINLELVSSLEEYSQLLFHKWFVDFNFPDKEGKPYKDNGGEMYEVDGKMIPVGWSWTTVGHVSKNYDNMRIPLSDSERQKRKGKYPYYGATQIMDYIDDYIFDGFYCLIAEDGSVIDVNNKPIMQLAWGKFWVNNHAHVLQGANGISTEYLYLTLKRTNVIRAVTGAIQKKINQENLNKLPVMLLSNEILIKFDNIIKPIFQKIMILNDENQLLEETRDLLIKKLIK